MDLHFYLWLMMSACAVALLIVNHKKQKMIDEYKSLLQKYGKGCNAADDVGKLKENIERTLQTQRREQLSASVAPFSF